MPTYNNDSSFAGIVDAFNQVRRDSGLAAKFYPASYEGIRDAIVDMSKDWAGANPSPYPPGWIPIYDEDGNVIGGNWAPGFKPSEGDLWFDSRQGRLMVFVDDNYYQTNGADVLTRVQTSPPDVEVEGALWYNPDADDLYLWDGTTWVLVSSSTVNTATLILANATKSAFSATPSATLPPMDTMQFQADYNQWLYSAVESLADEVEAGSGAQVVVGETAPTDDVSEGDLWFNTTKVELYVYYDSYWVPTALPLSADSTIMSLQSDISSLSALISGNVSHLQTQLDHLVNQEHHTYELKADENNRIYLENDEGLTNSISIAGGNGVTITTSNNRIFVDTHLLETQLQDIASDYLTSTQYKALQSADDLLHNQLAAVTSTPLATKGELQGLTGVVNGLPTYTDVNAKLALSGGTLAGTLVMAGNRIENVGSPLNSKDAATKQYVDTFKTEVANTYVKADAPSFDSIVIEKIDISKPAFDLSASPATGIDSFKYQTNDSGIGNTVTFGTTNQYWEYAWKFTSNEDFCWKHGTNKVFSITKDGPVCRNLTFGSFQPNGVNGTVVLNKIDVKERITTYETALQGIRSALNTATDFDSFKEQALTALAGV